MHTINRFSMKFSLQKLTEKKTLLIIAGVGIAAISTVFFLFKFGLFGVPAETQQLADVTGESSQESTFKIIEGNVSGLREELQNDFYTSLKRYAWPTDTGAPGRKNPFAE